MCSGADGSREVTLLKRRYGYSIVRARQSNPVGFLQLRQSHKYDRAGDPQTCFLQYYYGTRQITRHTRRSLVSRDTATLSPMRTTKLRLLHLNLQKRQKRPKEYRNDEIVILQ